jgi:hypothetical protein
MLLYSNKCLLLTTYFLYLQISSDLLGTAFLAPTSEDVSVFNSVNDFSFILYLLPSFI